MSLIGFVDRLRQRLRNRRIQPAPIRFSSKLRVTRLEERTLLDAGFGINMAGLLTLNSFDAGDMLTMQGNLGSTSGPPAGIATFTLTDGVWDITDPDLAAVEFSLSGDLKTLSFNSPTGANGVAIDANAAPLNGVATAGAGLQVSQLQIVEGGNVDLSSPNNNFGNVSVLADSLTLVDVDSVQIGDLDIAGDADITSVAGDITDSVGASIEIGGQADFDAANITLGDDNADTINFGTLSATATGSLNISENSDLRLDAISGDDVTLASAGSINDATADTVNDIDATSITLNAATGIGNTEELELSATSISAETDAGDIDLDNESATATDVTSLDTQDGAIRFDQSGGGDVNFTGDVSSASNAASSNGADITLTSTAGLSAADVTAQGTNVSDITIGANSILLTGHVNAGEGDVRLLGNGNITQTAAGLITADSLGIQQQGAAGDIELGGASNDVNVLAARNVAAGGSIEFFDATDLTIGEVAARNADGVAFAAIAGIDTNAGDINITSESNLIVNQNVNAAHNTLTSSLPESITLISRQGDFQLADLTVISTDEDPTPGVFDDSSGDGLTIIAGSVSGTGNVNLGTDVEIRTDGGVAKQIAPRPTAFAPAPTMGAENAFVTLSNAENRRSNLKSVGDELLGVMNLVFGVTGEENLKVVIDWGVVSQTSLDSPGVGRDVVPSEKFDGALEFQLSDADKNIFSIGEGGHEYVIPHLYSPLDLATTPYDRNGHDINPGILGVRFSVAQHESINIWGDSATQPGTSAVDAPSPFQSSGPVQTVLDATGQPVNLPNADLSLLSSTDTNPLDQFPQESTTLPLEDSILTDSGIPVGRAEWEFIAGPPPGVVLTEPQPRPTIDARPLDPPPDPPIFPKITDDVSFGAGAPADAAFGTDVFLQIRRQFELDADAEVVVARIADSSFISSRESFEAFVRDNPELTDGSGYEVWLVTETDGQTLQRPIVKFEITGGRPGPGTDELPDTLEPLELKPLPFEQPNETTAPDDEANANGGGESNVSGVVVPLDGRSGIDREDAVAANVATETVNSGSLVSGIAASSSLLKWRREQRTRENETELTFTARTIRRMQQ